MSSAAEEAGQVCRFTGYVAIPLKSTKTKKTALVREKSPLGLFVRVGLDKGREDIVG